MPSAIWLGEAAPGKWYSWLRRRIGAPKEVYVASLRLDDLDSETKRQHCARCVGAFDEPSAIRLIERKKKRDHPLEGEAAVAAFLETVDEIAWWLADVALAIEDPQGAAHFGLIPEEDGGALDVIGWGSGADKVMRRAITESGWTLRPL